MTASYFHDDQGDQAGRNEITAPSSGCANGCNAPFGIRCSVCNTDKRAEPASEIAALTAPVDLLAAWQRIVTNHQLDVPQLLWAHNEIARLTGEVERIRHQEVHHWLSDGGYSNPTIACGIGLNAVAHRDAAFATCQTCRNAAFDRGVLPS